MNLLLVIAIVCPCSYVVHGEPQISTPNVSWTRPTHHQSLHSMLANIEERLRSLESMKYTTNKLDMFLDSFSRRLETLDVRTRAIQLKLEHLETINQNIISYELKNDLSVDQLQRKFETNQDRLLHRISFLENRLDSSLVKLQGNMEMSFEKIDSKQEELRSKVDSVVSVLNDVKSKVTRFEEESNNTNQEVQQFIKNSVADIPSSHINKITNMIQSIEKNVNKSHMLFSSQNDGPKYLPTDETRATLDTIRSEVNSEAQKIGNKVSNMYNDVWRRIISIESLAKNILTAINTTKFQVHDDLFSLEDQRCSDTIENLMDITIGSLAESVQRKMSDLSHKIDTNFHASNSMLMGACHKLHEDRSQLETKLTLVLEKILETIINGTTNVGTQQIEIMEAVKSHNSQIVRTVAYNTNILKRLSDDISLEHKNLDNTILEVAVLINQMLAIKQDSFDYIENTNESCCNQDISQIKTSLSKLTDEYISKESSEISDNSKEESLHTNVNAVAANYSQGVLRILTDITDEDLPHDIIESTRELTENKSNSIDTRKSFLISLGLLNKSINMEDLSVIINEPKRNVESVEEEKKTHSEDIIHSSNIFNTGVNMLNEKELIKRDNNSDIKFTEKDSQILETLSPDENNPDDSISKLLMLYLKALKGNLSKEKFLHEANPQQPYASMQDLIKTMKQTKNFPSDFLRELEEWDRDTQDKESPDEFTTDITDNNNNEDYNDYIDNYGL